MKISELIKDLQEIYDKNGDIHVLSQENGCGGYALMSSYINKNIQDISIYDAEDETSFTDEFGDVEYAGYITFEGKHVIYST